MIVEEGVIRMDPAKVAAITDWPKPTKKRELQSFLGFCNFYRRFVRDFSKIARPLYNLTKQDVPWHWDTEQQQALTSSRSKSRLHLFLPCPTTKANGASRLTRLTMP